MERVEIRLRGCTGRLVSAALERDDALAVRTETVVSGHVCDQAELHGLLARIRDLGLDIVDVHVAS